MTREEKLTVVINSAAEACKQMIVGIVEANLEEDLDRLVASYMTILLLKRNLDSLVDEIVEDPMQFKFDCLDGLEKALEE